MKKIPDINIFNEWNDHYDFESVKITGLSNLEDIDPRRPDAYVSLSNILFINQNYINDPDEIHHPD